MKSTSFRLLTLCRGDSEQISPWLDERDSRWLWTCAGAIIAGCSLYGFAAGYWRAPLQAVHTAIKMPLLIFLTCGCNALLNGMLAQVLGSGLGFRQTSLVILMSFTIAAMILGSLSPVVFFIATNLPPFGSRGSAIGHNVIVLSNVFFIAYAGIAANRTLYKLLLQRCGNVRTAFQVLCFWLAGNLFLGTQISWLLRPFFGSPNPVVEFICGNALEGNFFEGFFETILHIDQHQK